MIFENENIIQKEKNGIKYIQFKPLLELGVKNAYSLKSNNIIFRKTGYGGEIVEEGYKKICDAIGIDSNNIVLPQQHHTDKIKVIDKKYKYNELENIDGVITNLQDIALATTNADCILYLLFDKNKKVIGNIHSGWKGSYQEIILKCINSMILNYNCRPEDIIVCICPSIRKCCFEVDSDVRDLFYEKFSYLKNINEFIVKDEEKNKFFIDTVGINNVLLKEKGILEKNIFDCNICSYCNKDIIQSYRVDKPNWELATAIISL